MRGMMMGVALGAAVAGSAWSGGAGAQSPDVKLGVDAWGRGDFHVAVDKWRPLTVGGDADAQFNLAQAYKLGRGVPEDPAMAESWFRRTALQDHDQAEMNYALALFQANSRPPQRVDLDAEPVPPRTPPTPGPRPADPMKPRPAPPGTRPGGPKPGPIVPQESAAARSAPAATAGGYRVQLGAFRDPADARALWTRVGSRVGGLPSYPGAGDVTRLQAGPFRTRADAQRACARAGVSCVVVGP